ncbi:response regulator [Paenibacillus sp. GCM10023248]|uniref:response regulator n=1 Tax=Bacillales TaxID=1385 RepID=UPI0023797FD3|nr:MULTISPECIES: response regulator [Bacillales]MDD9268934.1 response regulator [Paenibacillus sp. MAHUQ-63]MDR6881987.1 two-component system response regulator YesN [Bacillus sp. 3255]
MYTIIIVDDEEAVRESIRATVNWTDCGFELIGSYGDGRDAWESLEHRRPDVIITDISMPHMDGLALAAAVADRYRDIAVVIMTGYGEFEYAKQAVKLKVYDYIMKPVSQEEFTNILALLRKELDEKKLRNADIFRLQSQLNLSLPLLREQFLERMVSTEVKRSDIHAKFAFFQLSLPGPYYVALSLDVEQFQHPYDAGRSSEAELLRFAVYNIVQEIFELEQGGIVFRTRDEKIGILFSGERSSLMLAVQKYAQQAAECIEKYVRLPVSIGIGRPYLHPEEVAKSYSEALTALDYRFLVGRNKIISIEDIVHGKGQLQIHHAEWERKLIAALKTGSREMFSLLLQEWMNELRASQSSVDRCYIYVQRFLVSIIPLFEDSGLDVMASGDLLGQVRAYKTLDEVKVWLETLCVQLFEQVTLKMAQDVDSLMHRSEVFILENYANENLTLNDAAQQAYMSMNYFSGLFKQKKGISFIEYVTRVRLAKAKELLVETNLKAYEIAAKVGYGDPQYFSVIFKRHHGMTPKEYRASVRGELT